MQKAAYAFCGRALISSAPKGVTTYFRKRGQIDFLLERRRSTMAWLWESWEEFERHVEPVAVQRGRFTYARRATELEVLGELLEAVRELRNANGVLAKLGFDDKRTMQSKDEETMHKAHNEVINAVYAGEAILLFHKRLTTTDAAYGFLHAHDILEHWDRYTANQRILREIHQLTKDVDRLLNGYDQIARADERLLLEGLDLPEELEDDFRLARNLFSIGLDEVGLFTAARGLENVLRRIAHDRNFVTVIKNKQKPTMDVDFYDLIETFARVRWKTNQAPLLSPDTKALLHYLRTLRNRGAHQAPNPSTKEGVREKACLVANAAGQLWSSADRKRARLDSIVISKDW